MRRGRPAWPIAVRTVDVNGPVQPFAGLSRYARVRLFVMDGERLLGSTDLWNDGADRLSIRQLRDTIANHFAWALLQRNLRRELRPEESPDSPVPPTTISIVVPTCDRPDDLRRCLTSLLAQATRHTVEIIVVDNRPADTGTQRVAREFPAVRLVTESRPGLSFARNAGIAAATGTIVVATDDDVVAPPDWIEKLAVPFARGEVMCVTGNVLPLELETEAQMRFEDYGGLGKGYTRFEVNRAWFENRRVAVPTWLLGATANAAFRAEIFRHPDIGLLDEALGAGTPTGCSEDTYLFYKILKNGGVIVYEPSAYVWHRHRQSMDSLKHQIYSYSKGHVAYHLTTLMGDGDIRALIRLAYSLPKTYARRSWQWLRGRSDYPLPFILLEILGNLAGPFALWRSRQRARRLGRSQVLHALPTQSPVSQDSSV